MRCSSIGSLRIFRFYYSYFFCPDLSGRLSIQYVYERVFLFVFRLFLKAGAKLKLLFVSRKKNLKNFETFFSFPFSHFSSVSQGTFRVLRGANVKSIFKSHKLFAIFFFRFFSLIDSLCLSVFR